MGVTNKVSALAGECSSSAVSGIRDKWLRSVGATKLTKRGLVPHPESEDDYDPNEDHRDHTGDDPTKRVRGNVHRQSYRVF